MLSSLCSTTSISLGNFRDLVVRKSCYDLQSRVPVVVCALPVQAAGEITWCISFKFIMWN